ncbi:5-methylthioadenosine-S-adenosylhomocysteine deaminase protein [Marine Group I thaumarchaeote SCGC AAA799-D07]|jgi:cytosine/adenosine deaminase-related metal-dependent hydrolase|nr:5-methylthioadenosine-S-adenosylhomocysteine deaminase protein [Marine Group I thaumarchaeote SCGC AAA799-D07]
MILKNISILYGTDLKFIEKTNVRITDKTFQKISSKIKPDKSKYVNCKDLLLIPGLINSHTHIGDSIAKDVGLNKDVDSKIHPVFGIKQKILRETEPKKLILFMRKTVRSMIKKGITTFVDFRESELDGVLLIKEALCDIPIRAVILGRIEFYQSKNHIKKNLPIPKSYLNRLEQLLKNCDGLGISGSNENSDFALKQLSKIKGTRAIHCSETKQSYLKSKRITKKTEPERCMLLKPNFLVHMTYASENDLKIVSKKIRGIVVCPRANASLAEGIPDIDQMMKMNCNVAIGTDNVMINSPDMFREMDFLWKVTMGIHQKRVEPRKILKMATVNAGKLLGKKIGCIKEGYLADGVFIKKNSLDINPLQNPHASIVHRANESSIKAVMIGGKVVYGKL